MLSFFSGGGGGKVRCGGIPLEYTEIIPPQRHPPLSKVVLSFKFFSTEIDRSVKPLNKARRGNLDHSGTFVSFYIPYLRFSEAMIARRLRHISL